MPLGASLTGYLSGWTSKLRDQPDVLGAALHSGVDKEAAGGASSVSAWTERQEFERALSFAQVAIEQARCLDAPKTRTGIDSYGELTLSHEDWSQLAGLLLCARFVSHMHAVP